MEQTKKVISYISIGVAVIFMVLLFFDIAISKTTTLLLFVLSEVIVSIIGYAVVNKLKKEKAEDERFKEGEYTVCGHCGTKNRKRQAFCSKCKSSIVVKVCPVCKEVNPHNASFCKGCQSILQNTGRR